MCPYINHRLEANWPAPDEFRPERFLDQTAPPPSGSYIPFGLGPRRCPGQRFAFLEAKHVLAHILRSYTVAPASTTEAKEGLFISLRPKAIRVIFTPVAP